MDCLRALFLFSYFCRNCSWYQSQRLASIASFSSLSDSSVTPERVFGSGPLLNFDACSRTNFPVSNLQAVTEENYRYWRAQVLNTVGAYNLKIT